jgi:hypothetical protein
MSYTKLNVEDLKETKETLRKTLSRREKDISKIKDKIKINKAEPRKTRKVLAADSGFNSAYETPFVVFKSAVVNEEIEVQQSNDVYLFHVDNYRTDRLQRLLMQQTLYEALLKSVESGVVDGSIILVDGTITLTIFIPTLKDSREYKDRFQEFYEDVYSSLLDLCIKKQVFLLGFLKRTGSRYLAEYLEVKDLYDIYIMNYALRESGTYIPPIPIGDSLARRAGVRYDYATFYLNLKSWNYRFELIRQQIDGYLECIENLLYWSTEAHYGMNPIFSKADEYARVTKREANLLFNHVIHSLSEEEQFRLRLEAKRKTHFGYGSRNLIGRLSRG